MESVLLIKGPWNIQIIKLIEQGLSDNDVANQVPFRSDYVTNLRNNLKQVSSVKQKGV